MNRRTTPWRAPGITLASLFLLVACGRPQTNPADTYRTAPVTRRDITVAVEASGQVEPFVTVELKSKASGQILDMHGETGDVVQAGTLLVQIDKRIPRNALNQATAQLAAAKARRSIAEAQQKRATTLFKDRIINDVDLEQAQLEAANAAAAVVQSQVAVENARIQLDDTDVRAPITGTIIDKLVEKGQVISSPMMDVGGGAVLMKMADLTHVEVRTQVDETDVGKIVPGQPAVVTVTAFPNQPFKGVVDKIEPQATANQTVTTFAVRIVLDNQSGLLRPGMNADVRILVAERKDVVAVPTGSLRTERDLATSAMLVGLDAATAREQLKANALPDNAQGATRPAAASASTAPEAAGSSAAAEAAAQKYRFSNRYWVFVKEGGKPVARPVITGITDLDYSEVLAGLKPGDEVYLLPSSGLVETQQQFQQRMRQFTGMPGMASKGGSSGKPDSASRPASQPGERPAAESSRPATSRPAPQPAPNGARPSGG